MNRFSFLMVVLLLMAVCPMSTLALSDGVGGMCVDSAAKSIELTDLERQVIIRSAQKVRTDVRDRFERLHDEWYDASKKDMRILVSSSIYSRMEAPQFKELLEMGDEIIPLVVEKMMDRKYFFTQVLYEALMEGRRVLYDETVIRSAQDRAQLLVREWIWVGRGKMSHLSL